MATDFFLKIDGIDGESVADTRLNHIDLTSVTFGVTNPHSIGRVGEGLSAGKASHQDVHFTKWVDKSSPKLFAAAASGSHIKKAQFFGQKSSGGVSSSKPMTYFIVTLDDVLITSFQNNGGHGSELQESVSFGFSNIKFEYVELKKDGSVGPKNEASFNVVKNLQS